MFRIISFACFLLIAFGQTICHAQNEISFVVEPGPEVRDMKGNVLSNGMLGGYNQPQIFSIDIDNDGIKDVFMFDRSGNKVSSLIGDGKGGFTYKPQYDHVFPEFNDWVVFKDFDGDGKEDLWFKNDKEDGAISLFKNISKAGDPHIVFEVLDIKLRAFNYGDPPLDSSDLYCDWANIPAVEDVDGDGDIDFLTLQKFGSGITLFRNITAENGLPLSPPVFAEADVCWGDFQEGSSGNDVILKRNQWCFRKLKKHAGGSTLLLLDGDEDGDMDLILGNAGFQNLIYLQNGRVDKGKKQDTIIAFDPKFPSNTMQATVNTFPAAFYQDVTYDGIKDLIVAVNYTDKTSGYFSETGRVLFYENTGKNNKPVFEIRDTAFIVKSVLDHGANTAPYFWDMDGDGDQDLIMATNGDYGKTRDLQDRLMLYENIGSSTSPIFQLAVEDYLGLSKDSIRRMVPAFADINRDGKPELLLGQANGSLSLYNIIGTGKTATASLVSKDAFNINVVASSAPHIADIDGDGYVDLLVGCYDGNTFYFNNTSKTTIPKFEQKSDTFGGVMANILVNQLQYDPVRDTFYDSLVYWSFGYSVPFIKDLDGNGDPEFILGTASGQVKIYRDIRANKDKKFEALPSINYMPSTKDCYNYDFGSNSICAFADLDNDGQMDVIVGNSRGGIQFMRGTTDCNTVKVGIERIAKSVRLRPNPTNSTFFMDGLPLGDADITIINVQGAIVSRQSSISNHAVSVAHLSEGVYFVQVVIGNEFYHGRLVKFN